jgi:hypothetical protein
VPYKDQETRRIKAREYTAAYRARTKQNKALLPADNRCCALCGVSISTKRKDAKFCSREHKRMTFDLQRNHAAEYQKNKEVRKGQALKHYYANHDQNKKQQLNRQKLRPEIASASAAKRRAVKLQRTPAWLTNFDRLKIKCLYSVAAMLTRENKESWHVDHVIPLQGNLVSGLHVPSNMRVLRGKENISKHNNFEVI